MFVVHRPFFFFFSPLRITAKREKKDTLGFHSEVLVKRVGV